MCAPRRRLEEGRNVLDLKFHCFNRKNIYYNIVHSVGVVLYNFRYRSHNSLPMFSILSKKNPFQYLLTYSFEIHFYLLPPCMPLAPLFTFL